MDDKPRFKVLIADDSAQIRRRLTKLIAQIDGVEVSGEATDASHALSMSRSLLPDMVILDIRMPDGSGVDVIASIKQISPPPVVIMLTNFSSPFFRNKSLQEGADYFFDKSTEFEQAVELVRRLARESLNTSDD